MFKDELKKLRTEKEYTQEYLAEKLGVSKSTISMYENGNREPNLETLEAIADIFNIDMNRLTAYKTIHQKEDTINSIYLSFAKEAQENEISPEDINLAIETIKRLREKK